MDDLFSWGYCLVYVSVFLSYIRQSDTELNQKWVNCNVGNSKLSHKTVRPYYNSYPEGGHTEIPGTVLGQIFPGPWMFDLLNLNFFNFFCFQSQQVFFFKRECNILGPILRYLLLLPFIYTLLWPSHHQVPTLFQYTVKVISLSHAQCCPLVQSVSVSSSLNVFFSLLWLPCSSPCSGIGKMLTEALVGYFFSALSLFPCFLTPIRYFSVLH